ncbi:hypothetical protein Dimus_010114 [Dionaea muscipula]
MHVPVLRITAQAYGLWLGLTRMPCAWRCASTGHTSSSTNAAARLTLPIMELLAWDYIAAGRTRTARRRWLWLGAVARCRRALHAQLLPTIEVPACRMRGSRPHAVARVAACRCPQPWRRRSLLANLLLLLAGTCPLEKAFTARQLASTARWYMLANLSAARFKYCLLQRRRSLATTSPTS